MLVQEGADNAIFGQSHSAEKIKTSSGVKDLF